MNYNNKNNRRKRYGKNSNDKNRNNNRNNADGNVQQQDGERRINGAMPYIVVCKGCLRRQRVILTKTGIKRCNNHIEMCEYVFFVNGNKVICELGEFNDKEK